jgi:dolichol-phosphate mannosyltransferase
VRALKNPNDLDTTHVSLSVVFSFRNEEANIPVILQRARAAFKGLNLKSHEFVFVNDCSTDNSLNVLLVEQEREGDVVIVNTSRRFGVSEGVMCGLKESTGDWVVYMDCDLQDPPELIPEMLKRALLEEADVVYTTRRSRAGETWMKLKITEFGYWILNSLSSIPVPQNSGDFKLLSRRVVDQVTQLKEQKPFMRGLVTWVGYKQVQFFYDRDARGGGESHFPVFSKRVIYNFLDSALISFSDAPLKLALLAGIAVMCAAGGMLVWIFVQKALGWALPGWTAMMATMLVLGGIQLFVMGIFGLYIHTIYLEVKGRPLYLIDGVLRPKKNFQRKTGTEPT